MTTEDNDNVVDAIDAAIALKTSMDNLSSEIADLKKQSIVNRRIIRILTVSAIISFLLSIGLGWAIYEAKQASNDAAQASSQVQISRVANYETCLSTNRARKTQIDLWDYVLRISTEPEDGEKAPTPEETARTEEFRKYYTEAFSQINCINPTQS